MCLVWRRERGGNYIRKPRLAPDGFDVSTPPVVRLGLRDVVQIVEISNLFFESLEWREGVCTDPVGEVENGPHTLSTYMRPGNEVLLAVGERLYFRCFLQVPCLC